MDYNKEIMMRMYCNKDTVSQMSCKEKIVPNKEMILLICYNKKIFTITG